jgi:hypothetical protein
MTRLNNTSLKLTLIASALCFASSMAQANTTHWSPFSYSPRLSLWGNAAETQYGVADSMIPLLGNKNAFLYTDVMAKYGGNKDAVAGGSVQANGSNTTSENNAGAGSGALGGADGNGGTVSGGTGITGAGGDGGTDNPNGLSGTNGNDGSNT